MDDCEFEANRDRLGYELDRSRLGAQQARARYLALGNLRHSTARQIAAAHEHWQLLEQRCLALQRSVSELAADRAA